MPFHDFIRDGDGWVTHESEALFSSPHLSVHRVQISTPTRKEPVSWTVCHRKSAVVVAPLTEDGRFLLVHQERIPIRATIWEFPAGQIDDTAEEEAIIATAQRELREETGYHLAPGGELIPLGHFFPSAGFTDEHSHLFLARSVVPHPDGWKHDPGEAINECRAFTPAELQAMIASGEVRDANTLSAFARMSAMGLV